MTGIKYYSVEEIMRGAVPCDVNKKVREEMRKRTAGELVDPVALRRAQDWSYLSGQVVGAEVPRRYD